MEDPTEELKQTIKLYHQAVEDVAQCKLALETAELNLKNFHQKVSIKKLLNPKS